MSNIRNLHTSFLEQQWLHSVDEELTELQNNTCFTNRQPAHVSVHQISYYSGACGHTDIYKHWAGTAPCWKIKEQCRGMVNGHVKSLHVAFSIETP